MESLVIRRYRIDMIYQVNTLIFTHQGRNLAVDDFDLLWDLNINELEDVLNSMKDQCKLLETPLNYR